MKQGTIIFNKDLTTIGKEAFKDCENLISITIPKKVNSILANAFQNCMNLNELYYKGVKDDFTKIKLDSNWLNESSIKYVHCEDESIKLDYNYLTFTALEDGCSIGFYNNPNASINPTVEYSFDKINWYKLSNNVSIKNNSNMYCRGLNPNGISGGYDDSGYNRFTGVGKFNISGDIMTLIDYNTLPETIVGTMMYMFGQNEDDYVGIVDASNLILSAKTLTDDCYANMFDSCSSMVYGPKIEAETLSPYCYYKMFYNCSSLTVAPELPVITLEKECYSYMFFNCTSLSIAPELPATTLADYCYSHMFENCTSLTTTPELPATTLAHSCYEAMFWGCPNFNYIKCLATDISVTNCTNYWVNGVSSTGTFIKHPDAIWSTGVCGIPDGWEVVDAQI